MNILLINHYAGSPRHGMEYRPFYLAREWVRAGHRVQIVASSVSHVRSREPQFEGPHHDEVIEGVAYHWYRTPAYPGNGVKRVFNILSFLWQVRRDARRWAKGFRPDVVIASSTYPMDIWVARRIARLSGAKLVHEVHDLWPLSPIELGGMSPRHPFIRWCQAAEHTACREADLVVSMLPKVQDHMRERGLPLDRLAIVPNGITLDEWVADPQPLEGEVQAAIQSARSRGEKIVGYAGSHGLPNALDTLLDAAALMKGEPVRFLLVGGGLEKQRLQERAAREGLDNVTLLPPIPKVQIPSLLAAFDVAYIGWQRTPIYRFGIAPNKLMDYMMAGCTVLHSVDAGNDPVAESGCGLSVPPEDPAAVAAGLRQLLAWTPQERLQRGEQGRQFVLAQHTYPVLAQRFTDAVLQVPPRGT
jgi:glycosyltransferase involved in cell wall biosynthesis